MAVKLFVGGLSFSTSNERLREAFAATGSVESASVVTDRDTGRSRGFGFVEMATPEEAEQAISRLNGTNLDGRTIQVEKAKAPGTGGGGDRRGGGGGGRGGFGGGGGGGRGGSRGGGALVARPTAARHFYIRLVSAPGGSLPPCIPSCTPSRPSGVAARRSGPSPRPAG